ncbi:hypothetical protein FGRMN_4786 [Fusarium graminum]|nr:hypothetical protein FGRMN_4786 [Fusarium graminum]
MDPVGPPRRSKREREVSSTSYVVESLPHEDFFSDYEENQGPDDHDDAEGHPRKRSRRGIEEGAPRDHPCDGCLQKMMEHGPGNLCRSQLKANTVACYWCARLGKRCKQIEGWDQLTAAAREAVRFNMVPGPEANHRVESLQENIASLPDLRNPVATAAQAPPRMEVRPSETASSTASPVQRRICDSLDNIETLLRVISADIIEGNKRNEEAHRSMITQLDLSNRLMRRVVDETNAFNEGTEANLPPF